MTEEIDRGLLKLYEVGQKLGKGAYGIVWKATEKKNKETVALKKIFGACEQPIRAAKVAAAATASWALLATVVICRCLACPALPPHRWAELSASPPHRSHRPSALLARRRLPKCHGRPADVP